MEQQVFNIDGPMQGGGSHVDDENEQNMDEGGENNENEVIDAADLEAAGFEDDKELADATEAKPNFPALKDGKAGGKLRIETRSIRVPQWRVGALREHWMTIYDPIVRQLNLDIRFNPKTKCIDLRTNSKTADAGCIQKAEDFIRAFLYGFDIPDAIALIRMEDLFVDSFRIEDVKTLQGDNRSRAVGRIVGKDGKTKFAIENSTRTRVVVSDTQIYILGSYANIKLARDAIVSLILGSPPGKVYAKLRTLSSRVTERI